MIDEYPEVHQQGSLGICNHAEIIDEINRFAEEGKMVDVGVQVASDGRIWVCVNGMAFLRFKPAWPQMKVNL
jgi:N-acetyl-beta-hexosaminidase